MILTLLPALVLLLTPTGDPLPFPLESMGSEVITSVDGRETRTELLSVNHATLDLLGEREFALLTNCPLPSGDVVSLDLQRLPISSATRAASDASPRTTRRATTPLPTTVQPLAGCCSTTLACRQTTRSRAGPVTFNRTDSPTRSR